MCRDQAFQRKTNDLGQQHVGAGTIGAVQDFDGINAETVGLIKNSFEDRQTTTTEAPTSRILRRSYQFGNIGSGHAETRLNTSV